MIEPAKPLGGLIVLLRDRGLLRHLVPGGATAAELVPVGDIALDSRAVGLGDIFAAVRGERHDGHEYVRQAVAAGAAAVLAERPTDDLPVPQLVVADGRRAVALAAAWRRDFPSHQLGVVGVTGTDGKTTTTYLVRAVLSAAGLPSGLAGTIDVIVGGRSQGNEARMTTPEAPRLQTLLAEMVAGGDRWAVIEASSHGLAQDRAGQVAWDIGVLTNVTEEHLEFHGTREAYVAAKAHLFAGLAVGPENPEKGFGKTAVLNADDPVAASFAAIAASAGARLVTYGTAPVADVRLAALREDGRGLHLDVITPRWRAPLDLHLAGRFNGHNALAAVAVGEALALHPDAIRTGLEGVDHVPGRMERVDAGQPFTAIVDYAHTAEALAQVLDELGPVATAAGGGLIAVFGSGGERDLVKRPVMGRVAGLRCRLVVVTDEDPRGEDREAIIAAIAAGAEAAGRRRGLDLLLIPD
ncbi:MAG: Mur ligase family protein, partial [Candidatus Limnocylindrales bacterium]